MKKEDIKVIGLTFVNAYLLKVQDGFILIDSGLPMHPEKLESELQAAGCLPGKLKLILITHGDMDHTGSAAKLREKYHCPVALHAADAPMVEHGVTLKRKSKSFTHKLFILIRRLSRKKFEVEHFKRDLYLADGQWLMEFGLDAIIIHIPGHTKGSVGVLTPDGILFAGDTFTNRKKPDTATFIENEDELKASIRRIKGLHITTIYPGHGNPFEMAEIEGRL